AGQDVLNPYVLLTNSHDASSALRMIPTSVRVVCQNTLNMALARAGSQGVTIRHCESLKDRVAEARRNLGIISQRVETFEQEIQHLARVQVHDGQVRDYFRQVFDIPAPKAVAGDGAALLDSIVGGATRRQELMADLLEGHRQRTERQQKADAKLLEQLLANFHDRSNTLPGIAGSAWAAYNAVSEYVDHQRTVHGKTSREKADNRLNHIWFGSADDN